MLTEKQKQILDLLGNTLYQYMEKKHIDKNCSEEKWNRFVEDFGGVFAEECSELARELYNEFNQQEKKYERENM